MKSSISLEIQLLEKNQTREMVDLLKDKKLEGYK